MNNDGLVLAAEFDSNPQAMAACGLLRSAGIPAALKRGMPGITQPNWAHVDNDGLLLMVPVSFLPQARALLDSSLPERDFSATAKRAGCLKSDPEEIHSGSRNASDAESSQMTRQERPSHLKIFALIVLLIVLASVGKVALDFTKYVFRR
jgi:hypothetical protein